jgi:hypothetical protein
MMKYRDVARGLWNSAFLPMLSADLPADSRNDWDIRDQFEDVCVDLFSSLVLAPLGIREVTLSPAYHGDGKPLACLKVLPEQGVEILVAEAETNTFRGYDRSITAGDGGPLELHFRAFYDYWVLGVRDLEYCHAVVADCPGNPSLVGRNVLVRASQTKYAVSAP